MAESAIDGSAGEAPVLDAEEIGKLDPSYGLEEKDDSVSEFPAADIISHVQLEHFPPGFPDVLPDELEDG
jgi:hypothetical protein